MNMKAMKATILAVGMLMLLLVAQPLHAQFMPVVYDNMYGRETKLNTASADFLNGDVVAAGSTSDRVVITWVDRVGEAKFTKKFAPEELSQVTKIIPLGEDKVLILGTRTIPAKDRSGNRSAGRALVMNIGGGIERSIFVGNEKTVILSGELLSNGNLILSGSTGNAAGGRSAYICKVLPSNRVHYEYVPAIGEECVWFNVLGSRTEYLNAAFTSADKGSSVVRLDENGKPYFITTLPDAGFQIEKMLSSDQGDIYLVGQGPAVGGAVIKIRQEGDIVFQKQVVPVGSETSLKHLILCPGGELLIGGSNNKNAFFSLLRPDGTDLSANVENGYVSGITCNTVNSDCVIAIFDPVMNKGKVIKMSKQGRRLYEKMTAASYGSLRINQSGDLLMASPQSGRLSMLSNLGELLFDRYVVEDTPVQFDQAYLPINGEAFFMGQSNRISKLAHGIYVSDIRVNKPINGSTTAVFTVTLSGYSFSSEGAPVPVTVDYKTSPISAVQGQNFEPVSGTISFVPSNDGNDRYLNKFVVEVPVKSNDLLEGNRTFSLELSGVKKSYLIKSSSTATIEDQPAIVRMIRTVAGLEGSNDVIYELGIFKTNGTPLTNATKTDIVIDGFYGNGTADRMDFDMGRMPRLVIVPQKHSGDFNVVTLEDTRYETKKSVVVNFNKVYAMSDTDVSFGSDMLTCEGELYDQAALLTIESLGDYTKLNNVMSGLFKISLVRAKDGVLLTNNSGCDIVIETAVDESSTAKLGSDFVLTNAHDLRIWGDNNSSAVNLNGVVLYSTGATPLSVGVSLKSVKGDPNAGILNISSEKRSARFNIKNQ